MRRGDSVKALRDLKGQGFSAQSVKAGAKGTIVEDSWTGSTFTVTFIQQSWGGSSTVTISGVKAQDLTKA